MSLDNNEGISEFSQSLKIVPTILNIGTAVNISSKSSISTKEKLNSNIIIKLPTNIGYYNDVSAQD